MKFELDESLRGAPDNELLEDLCRCARDLGKETITMAEYGEIGKAHPSTIKRRFGSWPQALGLAGLKPSRSKIDITEDELFQNIKSLWINLGRQPRYTEVAAPSSRFSVGTYENRFGSWSNALKTFVAWVNTDAPSDTSPVPMEGSLGPSTDTAIAKRRTRREISDRQRFRILVRDGF